MSLDKAKLIQRVSAAIFFVMLATLFVFSEANLSGFLLAVFAALQISMWISLAMVVVIWRKKRDQEGMHRG